MFPLMDRKTVNFWETKRRNSILFT